jgi:hypothetical protein
MTQNSEEAQGDIYAAQDAIAARLTNTPDAGPGYLLPKPPPKRRIHPGDVLIVVVFLVFLVVTVYVLVTS